MNTIISGYKFRILESGVVPVGSVNYLAPGYMDAIAAALEMHRDKYVDKVSYVYLFEGVIPNTYKIGISYDPNKRIADCYGAKRVLSYVKIGSRALTFRYEAALHEFYRNCSAKFYGHRHLGNEFFVMTDEQVNDLKDCRNLEDLNHLMGIQGYYRNALHQGRPFDPTRYVKSVYRWNKVARLPMGSQSPFAGLISEASEYDE